MLAVNFNPFPIIATERLVLRQIINEDETNLFLMRSNANIMRYIPRPLPKTIADVKPLLQTFKEGVSKGESITWGITLKPDDKIIGTIGFVRMSKENHRAEVGYLLNEDYHGTGIMLEALKVISHYGFETLQLHSIEAHVRPENIASRKLLEKTGFIQEAHFIENFFYNDQFEDTVVYALLEKSFNPV